MQSIGELKIKFKTKSNTTFIVKIVNHAAKYMLYTKMIILNPNEGNGEKYNQESKNLIGSVNR